MRSDDQAQHLQRGDAEHAEHQMAHHLVCAAHLHAAPAVVVFDGRVDPLGGAAFVVAEVFGEAVSDQTLALGLLGQFLLQPGGARGLTSMIGTCPRSRLWWRIAASS